MKAVLLAGGKGTRLRPLTIHTPKPIVPIFNRPLLYYQLDLLRQIEIDEVILSLNYQPRRIEQLFGDGSVAGVKLRYVVEPAPLGTAGAVKYAEEYLRDSIVVFNGDVLTRVDLAAVLRAHRDRGAKATIVLTPVDNPTAYGLVETDGEGRVKRFLEKPSWNEITVNTINAGIYVLEPETLAYIPHGTAYSIERSFFPALLERGEVFQAYVLQGPGSYWIDIGTPEKYLQVHRDILDGKFDVERFAASNGARAWVAPDVRVEEGAQLSGPHFIDEGCVIKAQSQVLGYTIVGRNCFIEEGAVLENCILWPNTRVGRDARIRGAILGRNCHVGRSSILGAGVVLGDKSVLTDYSQLSGDTH